MEKIVALCKRRGFIFQSSEIYGGINGFWDYGPLGVELKRNIKEAWWHDMVTNPPIGPDGHEIQMVGVDCSLIMNPKVWEASGHATGFADPMVDCKECKARLRADQVIFIYILPETEKHLLEGVSGMLQNQQAPGLSVSAMQNPILATAVEAGSVGDAMTVAVAAIQDAAKKKNDPNLKKCSEITNAQAMGGQLGLFAIADKNGRQLVGLACGESFLKDNKFRVCPVCKAENSLTEPRSFNLMFKTYVGAVEDESAIAWLRPETAQGIFANFKNVVDSTRVRVPFGIAQVGKSFRNEINPRNYTFRSREFEQMEIEFFCHESEGMKWWEWWRDVRINWYKSLGLAGENLHPRNQTDKELAHYSKACTDIEYSFPFADDPQELEGVAHRGNFDLTQHANHSGKDLTYFDDERKERYLPTVIEPSAGADRSTLAFICEAYTVDPSRPSPELLKFHPRLAPIKAAIFPLVNKDGLPEIAEPIYREVKRILPAAYDAKASIGKRYARMDEAGTPYCFTVDGQTKTDGTVTVRDRDTGHQDRIDKSRVVEYLRDKLSATEV
jgi:glycyl-tRNA synthetase